MVKAASNVVLLVGVISHSRILAASAGLQTSSPAHQCACCQCKVAGGPYQTLDVGPENTTSYPKWRQGLGLSWIYLYSLAIDPNSHRTFKHVTGAATKNRCEYQAIMSQRMTRGAPLQRHSLLRGEYRNLNWKMRHTEGFQESFCSRHHE